MENTDTGGFVALLLAAGKGERFRRAGGSGSKLLAELSPGRTVIRQACENLLHSGWPVRVIVGSEGPALRQALYGLKVGFVQLPTREGTGGEGTANGLGDSIRHGVQSEFQASGWMIAMADMPQVRKETIRAIAEAIARGAPLAFPAHQGRRGHPVGFSSRLRDELLALSGDVGAREVVHAHLRDAVVLDVEDSGICYDVDLPSDLDKRSA